MDLMTTPEPHAPLRAFTHRMQPLAEPGATWRDFLAYWQTCRVLRCLVCRGGWSMCQPPWRCGHAGKGGRRTAVVGAPGFTLWRQYVSSWGGVQLLPERKLTLQQMMPYSTQLDASGMALGVIVPQPSRVGTLQPMDSRMGPRQREMAWLGPGGLMHHGNQGFGCTCRPIPLTPLVGFWIQLLGGLIRTSEASNLS